MSAISFTADYFSKEDEERELNELTETEKEAILDDKYGRRNNSTNTNNNTITNNATHNSHNEGNGEGDDAHSNEFIDEFDISDELLNIFYHARERLPMEVSEDLWSAIVEDEEVVEAESNPAWFLRCENYNAGKAAYRQGKYWKLRYEIFGEVDAVEPLTLNGALNSVVPCMVQIPSFCRILPDDEHGRAVICIDRTGIRFKDYDDLVLAKITWFVFHKALEKESTQQNGVVLVVINQTMRWDFPPINFLRIALNSFFDNIPVKMRCLHACVSSLPATVLAPIVKHVMPRAARLRLQMHNSLNQPKMLNELESFGLRRDNLPKSIGGSYDEEPTWINECRRVLKKQKKKKSYRDKRQRI